MPRTSSAFLVHRQGWIIFASALLLRTVFAALNTHPLQSDELDYDRLGWTLATTGSYSEGGHATAYRPVGYPLFVALIYAVAGRSPAAVLLAQSALDACTALLLFGMAARRSRGTARWSGWLWALYVPAIFFANQMFSESLFTCVLVAFAAALELHQAGRRGFGWLAGMALGAAILIKPIALLLALLLPFFLRPPARARPLVPLLVMALVPAGFWIARNAVVLGAPVLTTSAGANFLVGNHSGATGGYRPPASWEPRSDPRDEVAADAAARTAAIEFIRSNPGRALGTAAKKVAFLMSSEGELAVGASAKGGAGYRERYRTVPAWRHLGVSLPFAALVLLGTLGFLTGPRDVPRGVFAALLAATLASTLVFFGGSRFHFPLMPLLARFGAEIATRPRNAFMTAPLRVRAIYAVIALAFAAVWTAEVWLLTR